MQKIIGAKKLGESGLDFFSCNIDVQVGDILVVVVDEFQTIVEVKELDAKISKSAEDFGKVLRIATNVDIEKFEKFKQKASSELPIFKKKSLELGLMMKFIKAEYSLDGSKILIVFSSEERVDFRQLLKDLASILKTRIELKQIGQRDEVKMLGGVGPCGEPCCCARFLKDFEHTTVKMAKIQGLSLSPTKINGVCGRLMCCLGYESKMYEEILAKMPKINSEVETPNGKGIVVYNDILREKVSVKRQAEGNTLIVEDYELYDLKGYGEKPKQSQENTAQDKSSNFKHNKKEEYKKDIKQSQGNNLKQKDAEKPIEVVLGGEEKPNSNENNFGFKKKNFHNKNKRKFFNKNDKKQ